MKLRQFNGGVQTLLAPHLIQLHEGVEYVNIDHDKGHLAPLLDVVEDTSFTGVNNYGFYDDIHDETYFTSTPYDYELYKETLYRADRTGVPEFRTGFNTFIPLGIVGPDTPPDVAASGDPEDSAYFSSDRWRLLITATNGGPQVMITEMSLQNVIGVHIPTSDIIVTSNDADKGNLEDQDVDTSWFSSSTSVMPQSVEFQFATDQVIKRLELISLPTDITKVPLDFEYTGSVSGGVTILDRDSGFEGDLDDGVRVPSVDTDIAKYTYSGQPSGTWNTLARATFSNGVSVRPNRVVVNYLDPAPSYGNTTPDSIQSRSSVGSGWMFTEMTSFSGWPTIDTGAYGDIRQLEIAWTTPVDVTFMDLLIKSRISDQQFLLTECEVFSSDYSSYLQSSTPQNFQVQYHDGADWVTLYTVSNETSWTATEEKIYTVQEELDLRVVSYAVTYYNSTYGIESQPVYSEEITIGDVDAELTNIPVSADSQVDEKRIYRIGGDITAYTLVDTIPNAQTTYTDSLADEDIAGNLLLDSTGNEQAPAGLKYLTEAYAMLFGILEDKLRYTPIGEPTSWPSLNFMDLPNDGTGIGKCNMGLLVFTKHKTILITGSGPDSFAQQTLSESVGCLSHDSIVEINGEVVWASQEGIYTSNGSLPMPVSKPKLGLQTYEGRLINAVYHDEKYYLSLLDTLEVEGLIAEAVAAYNNTSIVSSGGIVSQWTDYNNGQNLTSVGSADVTEITVNGLTAIEQLENTLMIGILDTPLTDVFTVVGVTKLTPAVGQIAMTQGDGQLILGDNDGEWHVNVSSYQGDANTFLESSGLGRVTGYCGTNAFGDALYYPGTPFLTNQLAEIMYFDRVLTDAEISSLMTYLSAKWGIA